MPSKDRLRVLLDNAIDAVVQVAATSPSNDEQLQLRPTVVLHQKLSIKAQG